MSSFNCTAAKASVDVTCTPAASSVSTAAKSGSPVGTATLVPVATTGSSPPEPPKFALDAASKSAAETNESKPLSPTKITEEQFDNSVLVVKEWLEKEIPNVNPPSFKNAFKKIASAIQYEFKNSIEPAFRAIKELNDPASPVPRSDFASIMSENYKMESEGITKLEQDIKSLETKATNFKDDSADIAFSTQDICQLIKKILQLVAQTMSQIASNYSKSITKNTKVIDNELPLKQSIYESLGLIQSRKENTFASVEKVQWDEVGLSVLVYYAIKQMITLLGGTDVKIPNIDQPSFNTIFNQPPAPKKKGGGKNSSKKRKRKPKRKTIKRKRPKRKTIKRKHPKHKRLSKKRV